MECPNCNQKLKEINVDMEDAKTPTVSYPYPNPNCDYFSFEPITTMKIIKEKESPPKIKLSQDRLGMYFNQDSG